MDEREGSTGFVDTPSHSSFGQSNAPSLAAEETADLRSLTSQAEALSSSLDKLRQQCGHESTSLDIANATDELKLLARELRSLDAAVKANKELYTEAFGEDLGEIRAHLGGIFDDIADCCKEMQKANGPNTSAVGWLTKKRYVRKLQKHLEVNKTTLTVMRTVLHHGKEYGTHNSPGRLAESSPHTLQEDLAILETVFASRNAIKDLQSLAKKSHSHSSSTSSIGTNDITPSFEPGAHGRNLSSATGVDVPEMGDVLPASIADGKKRRQDVLARRFSRRGVRLAVHSSIMDTNAHDVPISLRKKWIHQAQLRHGPDHAGAGSQSIAQLSKISEANSSSGPDEEPAKPIRDPSLTTPEHMKGRESDQNSTTASSTSGPLSNATKRSSSLVNSPLGRRLGNVISRLSRPSADQRTAVDEDCAEKMEQADQENNEKTSKAGKEKKEEATAKKDLCAKEKPGWSYRLTRPFVKPELTTPDFERGF